MKPSDIQAKITAQIIAQLEKGTAPWRQPWDRSGTGLSLPLRSTGQSYQGINTLVLWCASQEHGYTGRSWVTFRQAKELGGHVREGQKGQLVVYYGRAESKTKTNAKGEPETFSFLKPFWVFNALDQCDGLPESLTRMGLTQGERHDWNRSTDCEAFIDRTGVTVQHGGDRAFYSPAMDRVQLPPAEAFKDAQGYYATAFHELTHATGHASRLDRSLTDGKHTFGSHPYAREELVAELGAAFLTSEFGLHGEEPRADHAQYLAHWLGALKEDSKAIFAAASAAQKAVNWLHGSAAGNVTADDMAIAA